MSDLVKMKAVNAYVKELHKRNVGPSGIIYKLDTCLAQTFIVHRYNCIFFSMPDGTDREEN